MSTLQIALAVVIVLLLAWWWLRKRGSDAVEATQDRIDTLVGWPPQPTRVLSTSERMAFGRLIKALPEYMVLAQVPLSRFINVPKRNSYADWLRRVGYQCVDFVVCDMAAQVVAVVELQSGQPSERSRKRLTRISRTLKAAQIPLQVWNENSLPSAEAAREVILPKPIQPAGKLAAAAPGVGPAVPSAAKAASPFDDSRRDSSHDEMIELLEPPPSTWFDDLDSDPVPLNKR
jgi:hypothetical protein